VFANRVFHVTETVLAWVVVPVQIVTTLILGLFVSLTFGLLLLPITFVYLFMWGPLLGLSWVAAKVPFARNVVGILGLPLALVANTYVCLMPSMGELENRAVKILFTRAWPYSWEFFQFQGGKLDIESPEGAPLLSVMNRAIGPRDVVSQSVLRRLANREPLDAG
jgi:hypothetical protein